MPFEDALGATNRPKDRFKGKDEVSSQEVKLVYNSSYSGGYKGGLVEEKEAGVDRQMRRGFGMCSERFEDKRMGRAAHLGPGTYSSGRGGLIRILSISDILNSEFLVLINGFCIFVWVKLFEKISKWDLK